MLKTNKLQKKSVISANDDASLDRRVRRTRRLLHEALISLIQEKGYENVSVQEILDRADVGRSAFYANFRGKEDLLLSRLADFEMTFGVEQEPSPEVENKTGLSGDFALAFFKHVGLHRPLAKALGGRHGAPIVMNQIEGQMIKYFRENWIKGKGKGVIRPAQAEGAAVVAASALLGLMKWWLETDSASNPEAMAGLYNKIILPGLASFLNEKKVL